MSPFLVLSKVIMKAPLKSPMVMPLPSALLSPRLESLDPSTELQCS